jgi:ABC-2 type transport system permease protein
LKLAPPPGLALVAYREFRWLLRDRVAIFLVVGVPLIAFAILAATFSSAVVRGLGVIVVDADRSVSSTTFVEAVAASPGVSVTQRGVDLSAATHAIRSGQAIAAVYLPQQFERDLLAGRRPQIEVFQNSQFMTPGNIAGKALRDAISAAATAVSLVAHLPAMPSAIGPIVVEEYVLTNPALNYAQFLLRAVLPTVLHVVIAIGTGYAVGSEFSRRGRRAWLRAAGGSPLTALVGKLAPLFGIFLLLMVVLVGILHGGFQLPFRGNVVMIITAACLFILAYQGIAALIQLLVGNLALGLSLTALIVSPAFGYAGVGFPVIAMEPFAKYWGGLLPLRWYIEILFDQAARGSPVSSSAVPFAILGIVAVVFFLLSWLQLRRLTLTTSVTPRGAPHPEPMSVSSGLGGAFVSEWQRVLADRSVLSLFVLAPLVYGIYYPQPYLGQLVRDVPIAVVDHDNTAISRELVQNLDAHEAVKVALRADTLADAQRALYDREVFGIVDIPVGTEREILKGNQARLPSYVDSTYFMVFNRALQGISEAAANTTAELVSHGARADGGIYRAALSALSPIELLVEPLFNPTGGYGSYVVPAAFVLILQQTLLMGAAMLGGASYEAAGRRARSARGSAVAVLGQGVAHLTIYLAPALLFLVILPRVYGFSTLGRPLDLFLFAVPFLLATSFMGQAAGACFKRRETAVVLFIATTLPQFFLVGVSWPAEAIPPALRAVGRVFPSESAINGLIRINQMGARLTEVAGNWTTLWILAGIYFSLAVLTSRFGARPEIVHA